MKKLRHREAEGRGDPQRRFYLARPWIAAHHALLVVAMTERFFEVHGEAEGRGDPSAFDRQAGLGLLHFFRDDENSFMQTLITFLIPIPTRSSA